MVDTEGDGRRQLRFVLCGLQCRREPIPAGNEPNRGEQQSLGKPAFAECRWTLVVFCAGLPNPRRPGSAGYLSG